MAKINYYLKRPVEQLSRTIGKTYVRNKISPYFKPEIIGENNIPNGSGLIVPNHETGIDGLLLSVYLQKPIHFLIQNEGVYNSGLKVLLWMLGEIPVNVDKRSTNKKALKRAADYLDYSNDLVGIFSEGPSKDLVDLNGKTIGLEERTHNQGAAHLAIKTKRPIIPIAIKIPSAFEEELWSFPFAKKEEKRRYLDMQKSLFGKIPYNINIGKPINPEGTKQELTEKVKREILKLNNEIKL